MPAAQTHNTLLRLFAQTHRSVTLSHILIVFVITDHKCTQNTPSGPRNHYAITDFSLYPITL